MKTKFKKLNSLSKVIDFNDFYIISFRREKIYLQGNFNSSLLSEYMKKLKKATFTIESTGYVEIRFKSINITLT